MREAVILSTARTPIGKAYRGAFNDTQAQQLGGHAIRHAVARAGIDPAEVGDVRHARRVEVGQGSYRDRKREAGDGCDVRPQDQHRVVAARPDGHAAEPSQQFLDGVADERPARRHVDAAGERVGVGHGRDGA